VGGLQAGEGAQGGTKPIEKQKENRGRETLKGKAVTQPRGLETERGNQVYIQKEEKGR